MDKQKTHNQYKRDVHNLDIMILCDHLVSPSNIGGVFRLADAYGVEEVAFVSENTTTLSPKIKAVSRGTQNFVKYRFFKDYSIIDEQIDRLWICLEITENSLPLTSLESLEGKVGIIIGNESKGVSPDLIKYFPAYHLKMFGNNSSMNVANSLSAMLFYLTQVIK